MTDDIATRVRCVSVAAPAYNEADGLEALVEAWIEHLRSRPGVEAFEVVLCDDGSTDGTGAVLARLAGRHPEVRVLSHHPNRGGGVAMTRAIAATRYAWVLMLDSDGQFPIEAFDRLTGQIERAGGRAVFGAREHKRDTAFARFGSAASTGACNLIYGTRYRDFHSTCRLVEGPLLRRLPLEARGLNYSTDVTAKVLESGERPAEVLVPHLPRAGGRSSRTAIRSTLERLSFVAYLALRRALLSRGVIAATTEPVTGHAHPPDPPYPRPGRPARPPEGPALGKASAHLGVLRGSGRASILRELLRRHDVELQVLINAYDDGLSTGALRLLVPGMLGPSDFRKNLSCLLELHSRQQFDLARILEHRLPPGFGFADLDRLVARLEGGAGTRGAVEPPVAELFTRLDRPLNERFAGYLRAFRATCQRADPVTMGGDPPYTQSVPARPVFRFADCALGNLLFVGAYLENGRSFNAAVRDLTRAMGCDADLINVTGGENRILVGLKEDGELLSSEAAIVGPQSPTRIAGIYLLEEPLGGAEARR